VWQRVATRRSASVVAPVVPTVVESWNPGFLQRRDRNRGIGLLCPLAFRTLSGGGAAVAGAFARAAGRTGVHLFVALALELLVEDAGCGGERTS
jgi:hypothetical protein